MQRETGLCTSICNQIIQLSQHLFKYRVNIINIVRKTDLEFKEQEKRDNDAGQSDVKKLETLYGLIPLNKLDLNNKNATIANSVNKRIPTFDNAIKKIINDCLVKNLGGQVIYNKLYADKIKVNISFTDLPKNTFGSMDVSNKKDKIEITISLQDRINNYIEKRDLKYPNVPVELIIAMTAIHETIHGLQSIPIKDSQFLYSGDKELGYTTKDNTSIKYNNKDIEKNENKRSHVRDTFYFNRITEINAERISQNFLKEALSRIKK